MKNVMLVSLMIGFLGLSSVATAQGVIPAQSTDSREDLIRRPPFYVVPQFEMKSAYEDAKANYMEQLPGFLKGLKTGANFSKNNLSGETSESLRQRLDDTAQWENLILDVKLACQVDVNSAVCKKIFDLRESYSHEYRRQSAEDRKAEKSEGTVQKKTEPAVKTSK